MDILKPLLRRLGLLSRTSMKVQVSEDRLPVKVPEPIHLSPTQREQIQKRIAEFIADSKTSGADAWARGAVERLNALPLLFDWGGFMALLQNGQVVWVPDDDEPGEIRVVEEERVRNMGLFQGTKLHPDLQFLLPTRPSDAIECPDCRGTGKLTVPKGSEHLAEWIICFCGGLGWLPPGFVAGVGWLPPGDKR
jgi:hypothetical protein